MSEPTHERAAQASVDSPATATADEDLLAALADDFAARLRRGEQPQVEEYAERHPALAERIRKVFQAVSLMEQSHTIDHAGATERVGATIGRYKLLERIGEGGFGIVYMAEQQQPVRRKVALKVIKPGMDSRQVLARFEAERQALAIMDHPNIAKVFDAGATDSGRPYFVMELVKGEPITEFCDRNQLSPRERLELFAQVCHAVQHAHQKGIIHRDIKPTNVLVAMHDTTPSVKMIDFGVAKALGQELTDKTLFTGFAQLLGTPLYMSPEQAGQSSLDIDTRSDVYSLGVLLYELLTGTTPFDKERFKKAAHDEICRIIREEEPPTPSSRLSSLSLGEMAGVRVSSSLASISAQRQMEPAKLTKLVRGDLDWIVMKALEKDRARRYETANGLAADVQRYLADEPVEACPPSLGYRLRKFARRNKATLTVSSLVLLSLMLLGVGIGWVMRDRTSRQARVAGQVELILKGVDELQREQRWPEALAATRRAEAAVTGGDADAATAHRVRALLKDLELIDRLDQIRMQQSVWIGRTFDNPGSDRAYAAGFRDYGIDVDGLGAEASIERFKARPAIGIPVAAALDHWTTVRRNLATDSANWKLLVDIARGIDPDPLRNKVRATLDKPVAEIADELRQMEETIDARAHRPATLFSLAGALARSNQLEAKVRLLRRARDAYPDDFWTNYSLAWELSDQKDYEGAVRYYTAAQSIRPNAIAALNNLGNALRKQGKLDEAQAAYQKAIEIDSKFAYGYLNLGIGLSDQKKPDEAIAAYRKAVDSDPQYSNAYMRLANALRDQKNPDEAIAAYRKAIEVDPTNAERIDDLAWLLANCPDAKFRDPEQALALAKKAVELDPSLPSYSNTLGAALYRTGDFKAAITALEKSMEVGKGGDIMNWFFLSMANWQLGNKDAAHEWYERCIEWTELNSSSEEEVAPFRAEIEGLIGPLSSQERATARQRRLDRELADPSRTVEGKLADAELYHARGIRLCQVGRVRESIPDFDKALELKPDDHQLWYEAAQVYLYAGDVERYRSACRELLDRFAMLAEETPEIADRTAKVCGLASDSTPNFALVEQLAERCITGTQKNGSYRNFMFAKGLVDYRSGRDEKALEWLQRCAPTDEVHPWYASAHATLAMVHHRLGHPNEARTSLEAARAILAKKPADTLNNHNWFDWLHGEILGREAEKMLAN